MSRARRLRGVAHRFFGAAVASALFTASFAASVVLHGDLPATRRFLAPTITALLRPLFAGQIVVQQIDHVGFDGVDVQSAEVRDPWGRRVIGLQGVHARVGVVSAARRLLTARGAILLTLDEVLVDQAEVDLDLGPDGRTRIEAAFSPPPRVLAPSLPSGPPRPMRIELPVIRVMHGWAHGEPVKGLPIQTEGTRLPGNLLVTERGVTLDVERFAMRSQFLAPLNPDGTADYHLRFEYGTAPRMWTSFHGQLGDVVVDASASLDGRTLQGTADATRVSPRELHSLLPRLPLREDLSAHAEVKGTLPDLHATARLVVGAGEVTAEVDARFVEGIETDARWSVRDLNPQSFSLASPPASLGGDGRVRGRLGATGVRAEMDATTFPFVLRDQVIPGSKIQATYDGKVIQGQVQLHEPGVTNTVEVSYVPGGNLALEVDAQAPSLAQVTRLQGVIDGSASAQVKAQITPEGAIDATVQGTYRNLNRGPIKVARGSFGGRVEGAFDRLQGALTVGGERVDLGGFVVQNAVISGAGPLLTPSLRVSIKDPRWQTLDLSATARLGPRPSLQQLVVKFEGGELAADLQASSVEVGPDGVALRGLALAGPVVSAQGNIHLGPAGVDLRLHHGKVDLPRLGRFLATRLQAPALADVTDGSLDFSADLDAEGSKRAGTISVALRDLCYQHHPVVVQGKASLTLDDDRATSELQASVRQATCKLKPGEVDPLAGEQLASLRAEAEGELRGSILAGATWKNVTGQASVTELTASLDKISAHPLVDALRRQLATRQRFLPTARGTLLANATILRSSPQALPVTTLAVSSQQLALDVPSLVQGRTLHVEKLDLRTLLALRPASDAPDRVNGDLSVSLINEERELAAATLGFSVRPAEALREARAALGADLTSKPAQAALAWLKEQPVWGSLAWRENSFETLPPLLRLPGVTGRARLDVALSGTLDQPAVTVQLGLRELRREAGNWERWSLSGTLSGTLDERGMVARGDLAHVAENVNESEGKASFWVMSTRRLGDLLWGRGSTWQVDAQANLDRWHLESSPALAAMGLGGEVSGVVQAYRMHVQPSIWVDLSLDKGKIYDTALSPTRLTVSLVEGGGFAALGITQNPSQPGEAPGELRLTAFPTIAFVDRLIPTLDEQRIHPVSLKLTRFDIESLAPLAAPVLADLRGKLDGELSAMLSAQPGENKLSGGLQWRDGVLLIPQLGQTLTGGRFNLTTSPRPASGETMVEIDQVSLAATTGRITGAASFAVPNDLVARYVFGAQRAARGAAPAPGDASAAPSIRGHFAARIDPREKIPVTFEGLALGDAHGDLEGLMVFNAEGANIHLAIPTLEFELPESTSQQHLQDLADNGEIGVVDVARRRRKRNESGENKPRKVFMLVGVGATLADLDKCPENINECTTSSSVLVRRASVDVRLAGVTRLAMGGDLLMAGTIRTLSGRVVALGKPFDVQQGFVRFDGPPTNPYLNVRASWDSPAGTHVLAELQGYLREATLRLRSEPARPESEVLALVLFGRDPSATTSFGGDASNSNNVAVGGGVASTLLNSFIDPVQVFGRRIETRVESTSSRGTVVGFATEIRPKLWLQLDASTATQRERQNADLTAGTLDWRFRSNWSLRTTVGDRGSSLMELLWQFKF